jgi:hypothetical protein
VDQEKVCTQVITVLGLIQQDSGRATGPITGSTCPAKDLRDFDSKIWPVATTMLAQATGFAIPNRTNLFVSTNGKQYRTVDQIAAELCRLADSTQATG